MVSENPDDTRRSDGDVERVNESEVFEVEELREIVRQEISLFSGPLPPPALLRQYNSLDPSFAERIFQMTEKEGEHRRKMEWEGLRRANREVHVGQVLGFLLGGFVVACGTYAAVNGHPISGGVIGTGGVVGIVIAFIYGSRANVPEKQITANDSE